MSEIDIDTILELSGLRITDERKKAFSNQLDKVLDYISVLNNVTQEPKTEFEWPINKNTVERTDTPKAFQHPLVKENAPNYTDDGFSVPKIIS